MISENVDEILLDLNIVFRRGKVVSDLWRVVVVVFPYTEIPNELTSTVVFYQGTQRGRCRECFQAGDWR